jgi:3-methyladenine DNA glycosylase AlkD
MTLTDLRRELQKLADPKKAKILSGFFKTAPGQYGAGDVFLGIIVPRQREVAKKYQSLDFGDLQKLLKSKIHEERLIALLILVARFTSGNQVEQKRIFDFYLKNTDRINNWDLVDLSAHHIVGAYLQDKNRQILHKLANSQKLWEKRISIISTFYFIRRHDFSDALAISKKLLNDSHDLIHKASGWMIREIGKRDQQVLIKFLDKHYKKMPRTMLRYAIEKMSASERAKYLKKYE